LKRTNRTKTTKHGKTTAPSFQFLGSYLLLLPGFDQAVQRGTASALVVLHIEQSAGGPETPHIFPNVGHPVTTAMLLIGKGSTFDAKGGSPELLCAVGMTQPAIRNAAPDVKP
jgi:hypothetical protein